MNDVEQRLERTGEQIRTAASDIPIPERLSAPTGGRPLHSGLLAVAAVAVLTVGGVIVFARSGGSDLPPATQPSVTPSVPVAASDSWREMPGAPVTGRVGAASVVTDTEFVVWGGRNDGLLADGAAYSFSDRTWRTLGESPLSGRTDAVAVWTGTEVVIFGGTGANDRLRLDGAAWNPATGDWRPLGSFPFGAVAGLTAAAWTGDELVLVGVPPAPNVRLTTDVMAIDVTTGDIRSLDLAPVPEGVGGEGLSFVPRGRAAVANGDDVLVVTVADGFDVTIDRLDVARGTWGETITTSLPGLNVGSDGVAWTGSELVVVNHLGAGTVFDPATGEQTAIATSDSSVRFPAVAVDDNTVFVGDRWLDLNRHEWHDAAAVPGPFREFPVAGAHDGRAYVWGGDACGPAASCVELVDPGPGLVWTPVER